MRRQSSIETAMLQKLAQIHLPLVLLVLLLGAFGGAMMISASGGEAYPWAIPQISKFLFGFMVMLALALVPQHLLLKHAYLIYFACVALLGGVEVAGFIGKGAQRWLSVGVFNVQPSELMKIAVILALARYFHGLHQENVNRLLFLVPPLVLLAIPAAFILHQPNLGTTVILLGIGGIMFFMAGVRLRYFAIVGALGLSAMPIGWHFLHDYQKQRVLTFLDPEKDPLGAGYNILQSMIAIGSGGLAGKGYLQGSQGQLDFLPEKHTDFIFTMITEEFGFIGGLAVYALYAGILIYAVMIGLRARSIFGSLLAMGVAAFLFIHMTINTAMVMGLIPVVGVPLPLLSYGGTITLTTLVAMGLLLNAYVNRDLVVSRGGGDQI